MNIQEAKHRDRVRCFHYRDWPDLVKFQACALTVMSKQLPWSQHGYIKLRSVSHRAGYVAHLRLNWIRSLSNIKLYFDLKSIICI